MSASEWIAYILVGIFALLVVVSGVVLRRTGKLLYRAVPTNKNLYNAILVIGLGAMLCIPKKSAVWVIAAVMFVLFIMVLKRFYDGIDEKGVCLLGRFHRFDSYEAYSMRRTEKTVEFRFYRARSIRMMAFDQEEAEEIQRFLAAHDMKQKEFQTIRVR